MLSFLNHHPDAKYGELFTEFPRLNEKQGRFLHYLWTKITRERYSLNITEEERQIITNEIGINLKKLNN